MLTDLVEAAFGTEDGKVAVKREEKEVMSSCLTTRPAARQGMTPSSPTAHRSTPGPVSQAGVTYRS